MELSDHFLASFADQGFLSKDPTARLDVARPPHLTTQGSTDKIRFKKEMF